MTPPGIVAEGFGYRHAGADAPALDGVSFRLDPGALLLVVGPSGSGKSTLVRAIAGAFDRGASWAGRLAVGGGAADLPDRRRAPVGLVLQDPASQLVMERAGDDVAFGLENRAWPVAAMRARVPEALAGVGLAGFEMRRTARLSGGEQQRLALAGSLAPRPGALVLDEPTANLDPDGAAAVFARIAALRASRTTTIVLVEHHVETAWALADLILALGPDGRPIDAGSPAEVLARSGGTLRAAGVWLPTDRGRDARHPVTARPRPEGAPVAEVRGGSFAFEPGRVVLRDVELRVAAGERVALTGPNGSGKSTLLRLVAGLLRPASGTVRVLGRDPARIPSRERPGLVGFIHQDPELGFLADTVATEVGLGLDAAARSAVPAVMDRLGLPLARFGDRSPYRLSGGEQRRLSLAAALIRRPRLLLLDEPTYGQDRRGHEALVAILADLAEAGVAMLAATHDERFVRDATDRRLEIPGSVVRPGAREAS